MSKRAIADFDAKLHTLFSDRTHWLRSLITEPKAGKSPSFDRRIVQSAIAELNALATKALLRTHAIDGLADLYDIKKQWHVTKNKGWGVEQKRKAFLQWFGNCIPYNNCVYVFWAKRRCRYVGRTLNGKSRPQSHFVKFWFRGVTRIDVYAARKSRTIPKLECLATHRFSPSHSKIKPSTKKWFSKCPICQVHREIRAEVKSIFRLR